MHTTEIRDYEPGRPGADPMDTAHLDRLYEIRERQLKAQGEPIVPREIFAWAVSQYQRS